MYKNITVATGSQVSIPLLQVLAKEEKLSRVIIPEKSRLIIPLITEFYPEKRIFVIPDTADPEVAEDSDLFILYGYPKIIKLIDGVKMINIHFGRLPENRGPNPVFYDIKEGSKMAYITIHEVTEKADAGPILKENGYEILEGETYGMLMSRLGNLCLPLAKEVIEGNYTPEEQEGEEIYKQEPQEKDLTIQWHSMEAQEIEKLVNACNPRYGGARTKAQGSLLIVWEVSVANVQLHEGQPALPPGTVIHASPQEGVFVICKGQTFVRLNIISTGEGIFSGSKLAGMGMQPGVMLG